jgi:hypothetical protein
MASKKKWFGLAALGAAIVALVMRRKREEHPEAQSTQGTIDT